MKRIQQRYQSDCSVACVAMVLGISHKQSLKLVHPRHRKRTPYFTTDAQIVRALDRLDLDFRLVKAIQPSRQANKKLIRSLRCSAILTVRAAPGMLHDVVWDPNNQKILDPWPDKHFTLNDCSDKLAYALEIHQ